jgi:hypothetical protein
LVEHLKRPFFLKFFLLKKLPLAFFAGLKVVSHNEQTCITTMPYGWMTKNPFRSMYFAAQAMAAEFSTALPGVLAIEKSGENIAMIIVDLKAEFVKKASSKTTFTCHDGLKFIDGIKECVQSGESVQVEGLSEGRDADGELVSVFRVTWSFKVRKKN